MTKNQVLEAAIALVAEGFSVIPVYPADHPTNKKQPTIPWQPYQKRIMPPGRCSKVFSTAESLAVICGKVSGNLECLDFDRPDLFAPFVDALERVNPELNGRLLTRQTPSGGFHILYRCADPVAGNKVLARSADNGVAIETRGEGGYVLHPPSPGYSIISGSLKECPIITADERLLLLNLARSFSEKFEPIRREYQSGGGKGDRPGDLYNADWRKVVPTLLERHGWTNTGHIAADNEHWRRPGKDQGGSATLRQADGTFYVWTSNGHPLEPGRAYDPFGLLIALEHGGDIQAATRAVAALGYGERTSTGSGKAAQGNASQNGPQELEAIPDWPVLGKAALYGLAGRFVELASRDSEADPAAILTTFLVRFGVECGAAPRLSVGDTYHPPRLAAVIVGGSSKSRKGTSARPVIKLFSGETGLSFNHQWGRYSKGPFSSGEGIIHAVRDATEGWDNKTQSVTVTDPGVDDKRLFVLDEEFAGVMAQTKREGNTLSAIIRMIWDSGNLEPLTKNQKIRATDAHVGWVSHVTIPELHRRLDETEAFNGFANRILWVCARRAGLKPLAKPMPEPELAAVRADLLRALACIKGEAYPIVLSREVEQAWCSTHYRELSRDRMGLVGNILNRAEAQVLRLAMVYCLLDGKQSIKPPHLDAAMAVWDYCEKSAGFIFHGRMTDRVAQRILEALTERTMTGSEISRIFSGHVKAERIQGALVELSAAGLVEAEKVMPEGGKGRPSHYYSRVVRCEKSDKSEINPQQGVINETLNSLNSLFSHGSNSEVGLEAEEIIEGEL